MPSPTTSRPRPLDGITVVSLEHVIAAPFCTRQLADMGARVIKIEREGAGDFARQYDTRVQGLSSHFVWVNRSKESLALDLKTDAAQEVLHRLLERADVFVQNLAPGAVDRMGLSTQTLRERYPRLIVCGISGYGLGGPHQDRKAYDLLIQAEAGFLSVTGTPDEVVKAGCSIADIAAGMYAYTSVLSALLLRGRTGQGSHIDVSMLEALAEWMGHPMYYAFEDAPPPTRQGAAHSTIYPYGPFTCGDGRTVLLGIQNEREWQLFCTEVLGQPELACDPRFAGNSQRNANRQVLGQIIADRLGKLDRDQVRTLLDRARIANASVSDMHDLWQHPQLHARGRWQAVGSPAGHLPALKPPGVNDAFDPRMDPVPAVGEHTAAILAELGLDAPTQA